MQKRKNAMIFEELNFLARNKFERLADVKNYKTNIEKELPILKGQREILWKNIINLLMEMIKVIF